MYTTIIVADYHNRKHCGDITLLMNHYAQDPMGGGTPLSEFTQRNLCTILALLALLALATLPHALILLCYIDQ